MNKTSQIIPIDQFWGIEPGWANAMLSRLATLDIVECARLQDEFNAKSAEEEKASAKKKPYLVVGNTAILSLSGPITKKPTSASFFAGGTSTIRMQRLLDLAEADADVKKAVLHVESPGGQISGVSELASKVKAFSKPIAAYIDDMGCSAAYWVASQADQIFANEMALVGNIGVYTAVEDASAMAAQKGVKVRLIKSGEFKGVGTPGTEVTEAQIADLQARVDSIFGVFRSAVMSGRNISAEMIDSAIDGGRAHSAAKAKELGLIDGICTFDACMETVSGLRSGVRQPTAKTVHYPAQASQRPAKEMQMKIPKAVLAFLGKQDPEALEESGIDLEALEAGNNPPTVPATDPAVSARIERLEADLKAQKEQGLAVALEQNRVMQAALSQMAETHWEALIRPDADGKAFATWAEKDGVISTYKALALLDGGGTLTYGADGKFTIGANLKAFIDSSFARTKNSLQAEMIPGAHPNEAVNGGLGLRTDLMASAVKGNLGKEAAEKMFGGKGEKN